MTTTGEGHRDGRARQARATADPRAGRLGGPAHSRGATGVAGRSRRQVVIAAGGVAVTIGTGAVARRAARVTATDGVARRVARVTGTAGERPAPDRRAEALAAPGGRARAAAKATVIAREAHPEPAPTAVDEARLRGVRAP